MLLGHGPTLGLLVAARPLRAGRDLLCAGTRARGGVLVSVSVLGTGVGGFGSLGLCVPAELSRHCLCEGEFRDPGPGLITIGVVLVRVTLGSRLYTRDGQSK